MPKVASKLRKFKRDYKSDSCDSDSSGADEEKSKIVADNSNHVGRWVDMLNKSENVNVTFLQILKEIEENIVERIDIFQKDLECKIDMKFNEMSKPQTVYKNVNSKELMKEIGIPFPIKDIVSFESFDNDLERDSNKMDALRELLLQTIDGSSTLTRDVYNLLRFIAMEQVIIHYSSTGKRFKGQQKKNFSSTNVYLCMEDVLTHKHKKPATDLQLATVFSNYFARIQFKNKPVKLDNNPDMESFFNNK